MLASICSWFREKPERTPSICSWFREKPERTPSIRSWFRGKPERVGEFNSASGFSRNQLLYRISALLDSFAFAPGCEDPKCFTALPITITSLLALHFEVKLAFFSFLDGGR